MEVRLRLMVPERQPIHRNPQMDDLYLQGIRVMSFLVQYLMRVSKVMLRD